MPFQDLSPRYKLYEEKFGKNFADNYKKFNYTGYNYINNTDNGNNFYKGNNGNFGGAGSTGIWYEEKKDEDSLYQKFLKVFN